MNIFNTFVFSAVASFFQAFWSDPVGKVFLTTALSYSISYMLYSSYISWFAGGYGGILLGQMGFTAADFLKTENNLLESKRKQLFEAEPPTREFEKWMHTPLLKRREKPPPL